MTPRPGTLQTASSAKSPRSAKPSFRANASKIRRTVASFSAAGTALLPAGDETLDVSSLGLGEGDHRDEPRGFGGIVVRDGGLEVLALGSWLAELPAKPAQQAHRCLVGHMRRLATDRRGGDQLL